MEQDRKSRETGREPSSQSAAADVDSPDQAATPDDPQAPGADLASPEPLALEGPNPQSSVPGPQSSRTDSPAPGLFGQREREAGLKPIIEALIFASPDPLTPKTLFKLLESEPREDVEAALAALRNDYERPAGLQLVEVAGGYQIVTRPDLSEWVRRLFQERKAHRLSVQALETLAVVAYKQPITGPEIAEIRAVNVSGVLSTLLERRLIKIAGRKPVVGRPFLYATTREFLIRFGLKDIGDLPRIEDIADVLGLEPPTGLADTGPAEGRLPLEPEPDPLPAVDSGDELGRVH